MDFINKFSHKDEDEAEKRADEHRQQDLDASKVHPAAEHDRKHSNSFLDKLTGREEQHDSPELENKKYQEEAEHEKHNFLDRITGKAEREEEEARRRREIEERERELERLRREEEDRNKNVFEKLGDKLSSHHIDDKVQEEKSEHHRSYSGKEEEKTDEPNFFDKITGKAAREEEERRRREEEERNKSTWDKMGDKLNAKLGGGRSSEKEEDKLDKAIDFVQEKVLKQGDQNDESAFEQKKDKMIAEAIRSGYKSSTGHEFFLKEKEEEERKEKEKEKHHFGL